MALEVAVPRWPRLAGSGAQSVQVAELPRERIGTLSDLRTGEAVSFT